MNSKIAFKIKKWALILLCLFNIGQLFAATCGDVNSDNSIDILDALLIAQHYVGLNPSNFDSMAADVDGNNSIDIVDALLVARYYVDIIPGLPGCEPTPTPGSITYEMQAEEEQYSSGGVETNHDGYTGTGFVNTDNAEGEWIEWNFELSADSAADCVFRYACAGDARSMDLSINGSVVTNLGFSASGAWNTWATQTADTMVLSAGSVAIRLTATTIGGVPNMDKMDITITGGVIAAPTETPAPTPTPVPGEPTPTAVIQTSFYVSPTGNDNNPGTLSAPFKTIEKARNTVRGINSSMTGDIIIYLRGGTYYPGSTLTFRSNDSGTNGFRIIYKAYQQEKPVISGGKQLTGDWTQHSGNIYKTRYDYDKKLRSLYVNGRYCTMTEGNFIQGQGGSGTFTITGNEPWAITDGSCAAGIKFNTSDFGDYINPRDIELISDVSDPYYWTQQRICVESIQTSDNVRIVQIQQPGFAFSQSLAWNCDVGPDDSWKVINAFELLDSPGEFYFNKAAKTVYYCKFDNEDMNTAEVIVPVLEKIIDISGESTSSRVSNITFDGITFSHNNHLLVNNGTFGSTTVQSIAMYCKYRSDGNWHNSQYNNTRPMDAAIELKNVEKIDFLNNKFINLTGVGLSLLNDAVECRIIGNIFKDISSSAINIGHPQHYKIGDGEIFGNGVEGACNNNTLRNNLLRNLSYEHIQAAGIAIFFVAGTDLSHNDLSGTPYSSISFGWWWGNAGIPASAVMKDNRIDSNKVANGMSTLNDGGLIYLLGYSPNSILCNNYLLNSMRGNGIHPDDGASYWTFDRNVIENVDNEWIGLWNKNSLDCVVSNNFCNTTVAKLKGTNSTFINNTTQLDAPPWSSPIANEIIANAGLEPEFQCLLEGKTRNELNDE